MQVLTHGSRTNGSEDIENQWVRPPSILATLLPPSIVVKGPWRKETPSGPTGRERKAPKPKRRKRRKKGGWQARAGLKWAQVKAVFEFAKLAQQERLSLNAFFTVKPDRRCSTDQERKRDISKKIAHLGQAIKGRGRAPRQIHFVGITVYEKERSGILHAHLLVRVEADGEDPFLFVCPVRPEWTDPTGLTGYYDVLSNRYVVPPFLEAVLLATAHRDSPVFVILDEMNLARVEYYLSDVLSCIETRKPLQLHSSGVPLEGSTGTPVRAALPVPHNLFLIGTINIDETTNPVSDKVLDRAVVIDMSTVDLPGFFDALQAREPALKPSRDACAAILQAVHQLMTAQGLGFGYRVTEEAIRYHTFATDKLAEDPAVITDALMVQKVLVKLRGSELQRSMLTELRKTLAGLPRSEAFLDRLLSDLDEFGSFQAAR
jgi:hypothetical protein